MDSVAVRDIPPDGRYGPKSEHWVKAVALATEHIGKAVFVGAYSPGVAVQIRRGTYPAFLPAGYDGDKEAYMDANWSIETRNDKDTPERRRSLIWITRLTHGR